MSVRPFNWFVCGFCAGKNGKSTPSASAESINRSPETHRRSKSILKRHQNSQATSQAALLQDSQSGNPSSGGGHPRIGIRRTAHVDPETEKLIPDNLSDCSPGKGPLSPQRQPQQRQQHNHNNNNNNNTNNNNNNNNNRIAGGGGGGRAPIEVALLQDLLEDSGGPIFICPPPPPMTDNNDKRYS